MAEEGLDWPLLDAIWISHFHLDHLGGLAPLLFGTKHATETKNRRKRLRIFGPKGLRRVFESVDSSNDYRLLDQPFPVEFVEVEPLEQFDIFRGVTAVAFDTPHTPESLAIRIEDSGGTSMVFTSDTGFNKALGSFASRTDLFLCECSFFEKKPVEKHLELFEAVYLARYSKAKKTVLTHLYPDWDEVIFESVVARSLPGCEIIEARDGMTMTIEKGDASGER